MTVTFCGHSDMYYSEDTYKKVYTIVENQIETCAI